jgi:peptidoglycan hydrolase-like protein with peptidoglycan-binding domain
MANPIFILDVSEEGIVATHQARVELPVLVAPSAEEVRTETHNTIRPSLMVTGCMNLSDKGFDFDSSFVAPRSASRFTAFGEMMTHLKKHDPTGADRFPPISIFGHADPTGDDEYNKALSGRRAQAVFAVFTRDVALWEKLFSNPLGGDNWGTKSIQAMLSTVGSGIPFYTGPIDGAVTPETKQQTKEAIEEYQKARGIQPVTGTAGPATRKVLFLEYMNEICQLKNGDPYQFDPKEQFLCRGKDKGRKGDIMGCSEFNPLLLLSDEEEKAFRKDPALKEERNAAYEQDRRVLVYVYKHDAEVDSGKWPCPRVNEPTAGCRERFWADSKDRLARGEERRKFKDTGDTMACRWYHAFAIHSPCEVGRKLWVLRLRVDGSKEKPDPLANRAYVVTAGDTPFAPVLRGFTDANGQLEIPVLHEKGTMTLKIDFFGLVKPPADTEDSEPGEETEAVPDADGGGGAGGNGNAGAGDGHESDAESEGFDSDQFDNEDRFLELTLDTGALEQMSADNLPSEQRLYNLGFGVGKPGTWTDDVRTRAVRAFQKIHQLDPTGQLDDPTRDRIKKEHEGPPDEAPPA